MSVSPHAAAAAPAPDGDDALELEETYLPLSDLDDIFESRFVAGEDDEELSDLGASIEGSRPSTADD